MDVFSHSTEIAQSYSKLLFKRERICYIIFDCVLVLPFNISSKNAVYFFWSVVGGRG